MPSQRLTIAQVIVRSLENEGIEFAYGITGSHLLSFFHALKDSRIKYVSVKHEGAAGFMALNYTKISQKPALLVGTAGPGAINLVNGVAELFKSQVPCFILSPTVARRSFGRNAFQEDSGYGLGYSVNRVFEAITKKSVLAISADTIDAVIKELFRFAFLPPFGPVHLCVPSDMFAEEIEWESMLPANYRQTRPMEVEAKKIAEIVPVIRAAKKPMLLIGNGCVYPNAANELERFIDAFQIPFVVSHAAKGLLDERTPFFGGVLDYFGHKSAEKFIAESDTILAFGYDFSESETMNYDPDMFKKAKLLSFNADNHKIGLNYPIEIGICGDIRESIRCLTAELEKVEYKSSWDPAAFESSFHEINKHQYLEMKNFSVPLTVPYILAAISEAISDNVIIFMDGSSVGCSSARHFCARKGNYFISRAGCSIAQGVCGVIGGKIASLEKHAFCIAGDGAFLMHGNEVLTAKQYDLPVTWIIFKDDLYNMVDINQCMAYNDTLKFCTTIQNPNYEYLAKAFDLLYYEVATPDDLIAGLKNAEAANSQKKSVLILIRYDWKEHLPVKPRLVKTMQNMGQVRDIQSNPYLMRAFKKAIQEKV